MTDSATDPRARFERLEALPPNAKAAEKQQRGREFERVLGDLLDREGLDSRVDWRPAGEQIDGSFVLEGRVHLLEAKWYADPLPASAIYEFRAKVDGKLIGTIGHVISISGFSNEAPDALRVGKVLNIILWDGADIRAIVAGRRSFKELALLKLRLAAEEGTVYRSSSAFELTPVGPVRAVDVLLEDDGATISDGVDVRVMGIVGKLVITESPRDAEMLAGLVERIRQERQIVAPVTFVPAGGKIALGAVAAEFANVVPGRHRIAVIADHDGDPATERRVNHDLLETGIEATVIVVEPWLEDWVAPGYDPRTARRDFAAQLNELNLDELAARSLSFRRFLEFLAEPVEAPASGRQFEKSSGKRHRARRSTQP